MPRVGGGEAGRLGGAAQPVAHGVGVDEQRAGGPLHGATVVEEPGDRVQDGSAGLQQRLVDVGHQLAPGVPVTGQRPLGEQVVAGDRSRRLRPARGRTQRGGSGAGGDARADQVGNHRADHHRSLTEMPRDSGACFVGIVHPAQDDHQPVALHGAQRVQAHVAR